MNIQDYVDDVLQIPTTRIGNRYIVEAIEIVLDTKEIKFYKKLSDVTGASVGSIEKAMRTAKDFGLMAMDKSLTKEIFGAYSVSTSEYIIKATNYYRRNYEK